MSKKIKATLLIAIILLLSLMTTVKASSFKFTAEADKEELNPGDEITITMSIADIDVEKGINTIEAWFEYDENIFEDVTMENLNNWEITYNTESGDRYGKFLIIKMIEGQTEDEDVGTIKLKVKENISATETEVKISEITSNDGTDLIDEGERIIKFKLLNSDNDNDDNNQTDSDNGNNTTDPDANDNNNNTNTNTNTNTNNNNSSNNNNNGSSSGNKKPNSNVNTGDITIIVAVTVISIVIILNIIVFIVRKKKNNKDTNKQD